MVLVVILALSTCLLALTGRVDGQVQSQTVLKLAQIYPYNSPDPQWNDEYRASRDAHALAVKHAQQDGFLPNVNVTLLDYDSTITGSGDEGRSVFKSMDALNDGVVGVLGGGGSVSAAQISLATRAKRIPVCSLIAGSSTLSDKADHPWFYRFLYSTNVLAMSTIHFMKISANWTRFSLLYEGGNSAMLTYATAVSTLAQKHNMSVVTSSVFYPNAGAFSDTQDKIAKQLEANDINIVVFVHYSASACKLIEHLSNTTWFKQAPPERPRVFILVNSPMTDLMALSRPMTLKLLKTAAWIRITVKSLDLPNLYPQFMSDYLSETNQTYPYPKLLYFAEAYSCAYAMVAGLHRLAHVNNGTTFANVAERSQSVFQNMSLSLFNLTREASLSTGSPTPRISAMLDSAGDPIPIYSILHAATPILDANGDLIGTTEVTFATVPPEQNVSLIPFSFPGLSAGQFPLDAQPVTVHVATWASSTGLITTISVAVCTALTFASAAFLIHNRRSPIVRRSSLTVLLLQHFASLCLYWNALAHLDVPTPYVCTARTVTTSMGMSLFLMLIYARLAMLYQVQTFRQNTAGQLIGRGSSPKASQRQEQVQTDTRRLSGFRKAIAARAPLVVAAAGASESNKATTSSSGESSMTASLWKQATYHAGRHLSEKTAALRQLRVSRRASLRVEAMVSRIEDVIGALNGTKPTIMHKCLLQNCGPFVVLYACAGAYFFTSCAQVVQKTLFEPHKSELKCTCVDTASNTMSWLFILLVNAGLLLVSLYLGGTTRNVSFNVYESRRSIFALVNAMVGTGLYIYIQSSQAFYPYTLFYALLVTFLSISTLGFYVAPLYLRMYTNKTDGQHASRADSNEELSSGLSKLSAAPSALEEANEPGASSRPIMIRQRTISGFATGVAAGPAGPVVLHSAIREANEPAHPGRADETTSIASGGCVDIPRAGVPVYDVVQSGDEASMIVGAFPVLAKHHAPSANLRSALRQIGYCLWRFFGREARKKREWMKLQVWCIAGTEQGVGMVQLSGIGFNKDAFRLGGPFASFEAQLTDVTDSKGDDIVTPNTRSEVSQPNPSSPRPSQHVLLHGRHSHTWLLIRFPHAQLAAHFVALFKVKPATIRSTEQAMEMMSTF